MKKLKCIDAFTLKLLAMALMLCDHMWATVIPGNMWLTNLGRLAFPIFAFQIAEGWACTHNRKKYLKRMFLFALISEIPFNLMSGGGVFFPFHQNVMFTFLIAMLLLLLLEKAKEKGRIVYFVTVVLACVLGYFAGILLMVDYFGTGVLTVLLFYFCRGKKFGWLGELFGMLYLNGHLLAGLILSINLGGFFIEFPQQALAVLALLPIWLYNGKQGVHNKAVQYVGYAFYPLHMLILALIGLYVL